MRWCGLLLPWRNQKTTAGQARGRPPTTKQPKRSRTKPRLTCAAFTSFLAVRAASCSACGRVQWQAQRVRAG